MKWIMNDLETMEPWLSALRRDLHRCPEPALEEHETARRIRLELENLGIRVQQVGATGVLGTLRGKRPGRHTVALRADMDALPISEENTCSYRSRREGYMHACGHDAHTACLLGAARVLAAHRDRFGGEIRFIFQPAEETGRGAKDFLALGALKGVDRVFGLHVAPDLPLGTVGLKPGLNNAAVDGFRIEVQGKAAHVSTPQLGTDALYIASLITVALQAQVSRCTDPVEPVILGIGTFRSGTAYNIVADSAVLEGTTRTVSPSARQRAREQVETTACTIASLYGGRARVVWDDIASALINHPGATQEVAALVGRLRPDLTVLRDRPLSLSGDNFSEFQTLVPGVYAYLGSAGPGRPETGHSIHSSRFDLDEGALPIGTWLYAASAVNWLAEPGQEP